MTTIVYKDGVVAWDSRVTQNDTIMSDKGKKHHSEGKDFVVYSGLYGYGEAIFKGMKEGEGVKDIGRYSGIAYIDGKLFDFSFATHDSWSPQPLDHPTAYGTGREFALGAMDTGCSAVEAVKVAIGRDTSSGGKINSRRVKVG